MADSDPRAAPERMSRLALLLIAGLTVGWGINWPILKVGIEALQPWTFRALSVPTGGLMLLAVARLSGLPMRIPPGRVAAVVVVSLVNIFCWYGLSAIAIDHLTAGRAVMLAFTMPVWACLMGVVWLKERMTGRRVAGLVSGIAGIAVLMGGDVRALGTAPIGAAIMLMGSLSWAVGTVLLKRVSWNMPVVVLTGWQTVIGGLPLVLGALAFESWDRAGFTPGAVFAVAYNMVVSIALGTYLWYKIVSLLPAGASAVGTLMIPVIGVASGAVALGEPLGVREGVALILVLGALALTLLGPAPARRAP